MSKLPSVLIYRTDLLAATETFVLAQASALRRYRPQFAGLQRSSNSLPLPGSPILAGSHNSLFNNVRKKFFRLTGYEPGFDKCVREARTSLIHAHFAPDGAAILPLARRLGLPLIVTLHGFDVTVHDREHAASLLGRIFLARRKALWNHSALFLCVSDFIREQAIASGYPAHKLRTHFIGIDRSLFVAAPFQTAHTTVLFVGRLAEKKGCEYLIRAMAAVQKLFPKAALDVIGAGELGGSLRSLAETLGVTCNFLGVRSAVEIRQALAASAVFCVPSITAPGGDSEGLGMVFLEAQAMGIPVVSFRHGGIPEAVVDGESALLAREGDTDKLAACIIQYLSDPALRRRSGQKGQRYVAGRFDLHQQTQELEQIYDEILAR